jgi:YHS domain-containing protein
MMNLRNLAAISLGIALLAGPLAASAAEEPAGKAKPYPLKTCIVSDEKLGEMGDPFTFTYEGQEFKLCCKSCKKDFDKNPKKFVKKLATEEKKASKK